MQQHFIDNSINITAGFSLTFEVEGYWLVSRQVPCETEGQRPKPLGGSGGMLPGKVLEIKSPIIVESESRVPMHPYDVFF